MSPEFLPRSVGQSRLSRKERRILFTNATNFRRKSGISVPGVVRMPRKYCKCPVELFRHHQAGKLMGQRHAAE
jgi:hypothetical protein